MSGSSAGLEPRRQRPHVAGVPIAGAQAGPCACPADCLSARARCATVDESTPSTRVRAAVGGSDDTVLGSAAGAGERRPPGRQAAALYAGLLGGLLAGAVTGTACGGDAEVAAGASVGLALAVAYRRWRPLAGPDDANRITSRMCTR